MQSDLDKDGTQHTGPALEYGGGLGELPSGI